MVRGRKHEADAGFGTQRLTSSGLMSILTPSEDSTSAAPERDDSARLPVFCHGYAAACDDEGGAGRDVDRTGTVAAGADQSTASGGP